MKTIFSEFIGGSLECATARLALPKPPSISEAVDNWYCSRKNACASRRCVILIAASCPDEIRPALQHCYVPSPTVRAVVCLLSFPFLVVVLSKAKGSHGATRPMIPQAHGEGFRHCRQDGVAESIGFSTVSCRERIIRSKRLLCIPAGID